MKRRPSCNASLIALALSGCAEEAKGFPTIVTAWARPGSGLDLDGLVVRPEPIRRDRVHAGKLNLVLSQPATLSLEHPEGCPSTVPAEAMRAGERIDVEIQARIDLGPDRPQLGFDQPFTIEASLRCREQAHGRVTWRKIAGPDIPWRVEPGGLAVHGRTPPLTALVPMPMPWGIVPFSPATRGEVTLEATWSADGLPDVVRSVHVAATSRATGIPTVGLHHVVVLTGTAWTLESFPRGGRADLEIHDLVTTLDPDAAGPWVLRDRQGKLLTIIAGQADELPLDCGRAECHGAIARELVANPMATVLQRRLDGHFGDEDDPRCTLPCHAAGEPGVPDGGFADVATQHGFVVSGRASPGTWASLPRAVRRLGGVGCIACHGPTGIPEPSDRWTVLRTDVCAICHDAPPRYGHVAAWRRSAKATSDEHPATRRGPCATCHTTAGFLASIGARPIDQRANIPDSVGPIGVTCVACHANHGAHLDGALVRSVGMPPVLEPVPVGLHTSSSSVCLRCHAPVDGTPWASAAAIWLGRGGVRLENGASIPMNDGPGGEHVQLPAGCLMCHTAAPERLTVERGANHGFVADLTKCVECHPDGRSIERATELNNSIQTRARVLYERLRAPQKGDAAMRDFPPHAADTNPSENQAHSRALRNVLLVLEDRAAGVHNAPYARALLDQAELDLRHSPQ